MRSRVVAITFAVLVSVSIRLSAQTSVVPPSQAVLDRANLQTEWSAAIPVAGRQDGIAHVQVATGGQVFVRTKGGLLLALDSKTGNQQWSLTFDAKDTAFFPVAYNDRFAVVTNLVTLYCLHRYTGLVEFQMKLPLVPSAGPVIDRNTVYVTMNGIRVTAYELPAGLQMPERKPRPAGAVGALPPDKSIKNPADEVVTRYGGSARRQAQTEDRFERRSITLESKPISGESQRQRSPSLSILPTVRPPYTAFDNQGKYILRAESLSTVSSLRQPYSLQDPTQAHNQRTPSLASIPPSVAAVTEMTSLLPRPYEPRIRWVYGSTTRLTYLPLTTNFRIWFSGESNVVQALLQDDRAVQINARMPNLPAAQPTQGDDVGYFPLTDGNLLAIDLTAGVGSAIKQVWRANVGGAMNRSPLVTVDSVYQGGDSSGVARVDRKSGDILWRTDEAADSVLAVNEEAVYVRDKLGMLRVYDRNRVHDVTTKRGILLSSIDLSAFDLPTQNLHTDRVFMASSNGTLICLRDKAAKYTNALAIAPAASRLDPTLNKKPTTAAPAPGETPPAAPAPMAEQPKKEEPKKEG